MLLIVNYFVLAFVKQCLCHNKEEVCIIENENHKKISVIYHIDKQIYLCIILPQFDTKDAGTLVNQASNLLAIMFIYINFNIYFNTKEYVSTFLQISDLLLNTESTISIVCRHVSQFQSTNIPETPSFLRILATKNANVSKYKIEPLEQPNIVFGVGAGG